MGSRHPLLETISRLQRANLGHYIYLELESNGDELLVGYALNEIYRADIPGCGLAEINYFCSAFLLPEARERYSLYRMLGAARLSGNENFLMMRTQSPLAISTFRRLCEREAFQLYGPSDPLLPSTVGAVVASRFEQSSLVHRAAYPARVSPPRPPRDAWTRGLMQLIDPDRGDALVLFGISRATLRQPEPSRLRLVERIEKEVVE